VAALEHENFFSCALQVGGIDQAVMASTDHDDIVFVSHVCQIRAVSLEL
jgi:hypothetical protein